MCMKLCTMRRLPASSSRRKIGRTLQLVDTLCGDPRSVTVRQVRVHEVRDGFGFVRSISAGLADIAGCGPLRFVGDAGFLTPE